MNDPGNAGKYDVRQPGVNNNDLAIAKSFPIKNEKRTLSIGWEAYNAFNHTQYASVSTAARFTPQGQQTNALFGQVGLNAGAARDAGSPALHILNGAPGGFGASLPGQTIVFCRLSTRLWPPRRPRADSTGHKHRWPVVQNRGERQTFCGCPLSPYFFGALTGAFGAPAGAGVAGAPGCTMTAFVIVSISGKLAFR